MATAADHQGADAKWLLTEETSWSQVNAFPHREPAVPGAAQVDGCLVAAAIAHGDQQAQDRLLQELRGRTPRPP
ncbi:hypothetical protein ACWDA7_06495 [Streptomyces sp. NPDC001156]